MNDVDLFVRPWSGANIAIHRRRRSSSISAATGRDLPASADDQDVRSASCVQCVTLVVGQIVAVIVDDQFQLGALRQAGRFVEVQSPVLHTRAQKGDMSSPYGRRPRARKPNAREGTGARRATRRRTPTSRFKDCVETV